MSVGELISFGEARSAVRLAEYDRLETEDHQAAYGNAFTELHRQFIGVAIRIATQEERERVGCPREHLFVVTVQDHTHSSGGLSRFIARHRSRPLPPELGAVAFLQELEAVGEPLSIYDLPKRGSS